MTDGFIIRVPLCSIILEYEMQKHGCNKITLLLLYFIGFINVDDKRIHDLGDSEHFSSPGRVRNK